MKLREIPRAFCDLAMNLKVTAVTVFMGDKTFLRTEKEAWETDGR